MFVSDNCDDPGIPTNGYRKGNETTYGSKIEYACNKGYKLIGLDNIICQKYGNWTGQIPKCQSICKFMAYSSFKRCSLL